MRGNSTSFIQIRATKGQFVLAAIGFHELSSSAASVLCQEWGDDKETVRLDYVLSIFTHSAVNNSDN